MPFYIRGPGIPAGQVLPYPGSFIDVAPTLLTLSGGPSMQVHAPQAIDNVRRAIVAATLHRSRAGHAGLATLCECHRCAAVIRPTCIKSLTRPDLVPYPHLSPSFPRKKPPPGLPKPASNHGVLLFIGLYCRRE